MPKYSAHMGSAMFLDAFERVPGEDDRRLDLVQWIDTDAGEIEEGISDGPMRFKVDAHGDFVTRNRRGDFYVKDQRSGEINPWPVEPT